MNVATLRAHLNREGIKNDAYSLDGSPIAYEGLVLTRTGEQWRIDHFERGMRRELGVFLDEESACHRMYELLTEYFQR